MENIKLQMVLNGSIFNSRSFLENGKYQYDMIFY